MALSNPGPPERKNVNGARQELAAGELAHLLHQRSWKSALLERLERLARRQMRGAPEAIGSSLAAVVRLQLQDIQQQRQDRFLPCRQEARHELRGRARKFEVEE